MKRVISMSDEMRSLCLRCMHALVDTQAEISQAASVQVKMAERDSGRKSPCSAGCSGCCHMITTVHIVEVLAMLCYHSAVDEQDVRRDADVIASPDMTSDMWMKKLRPCPFLNEGKCSAYVARPEVCRTYAVVDDAEKCWTPMKVARVARNHHAFQWYTRHIEVVCRLYGLPFVYGPIQNVLEIAIDAASSESPAKSMHAISEARGMRGIKESINRWFHFSK